MTHAALANKHDGDKIWGHRSVYCADVEIQAQDVDHNVGAANGAKTWIHDRVFVKLITPCLLTWAFWQRFLVLTSSPPTPFLRTSLHEAAPEYLRTYSHLMKHASDFGNSETAMSFT